MYDLGLNVDQSKYRTYDYITGRWWQVDPKADKGGQESWSPYQYAFDNPVRNNDPEGDICVPCVTAAVGAVIGAGINAYDQYKEGTLDLTDGKSLARLGTAFVAGGIAGSGIGGLAAGVAVAAGGEAADQLISTGKVNDPVKVGIAAGAGLGAGLLAKGATAVAVKTGLIAVVKGEANALGKTTFVSGAKGIANGGYTTTTGRSVEQAVVTTTKATAEGVNGIVSNTAGKTANTVLTPAATTSTTTTTNNKPEERLKSN